MFLRTCSKTFARNCPLLLAISTLILQLPLSAQSESHPPLARTENAQAENARTENAAENARQLPVSGFVLPTAETGNFLHPGARGGGPAQRRPFHAFGFPDLAQAAATIFSGTVTSIAPHCAAAGQGVDTVCITFHVEHAIRGVIPDQVLTISQWMGLWLSGQRYRVGERVLLFLYPPSSLGLTSSVGGPMGRFAVDARGSVSLSAQHISAFSNDFFLAQKSRVSFSQFTAAVHRAEFTK